MILCGTGHRPEKLTPQGKGIYFEGLPELEGRLIDLCLLALERFKPEQVISGFALGFDLALAEAAIQLELPLVAAVPFARQEKKWTHSQQAKYQELLTRADEIKVVNFGGYAFWKMNARNEWIVDHADLVLALWNGAASGTGNCVEYATAQGVEVVNLWNNWQRHSGFWMQYHEQA